jgi:hypothetical protein
MLRAMTRRTLLASPIVLASAMAQTPYVPKQSDRPEELPGDEPGFVSMFDGKTLAQWDGDFEFWKVIDGIMTGEIKADKPLLSNTFLVWKGGEPADFEMKAEFRISADGNSGVQYRSDSVLDPATPGNKFILRGYQYDMDGKNRYVGNLYEERGRMFLAQRGEVTHVTGLRKPTIISRLSSAEELAKTTNPDWNELAILARGNTVMHRLNGRLLNVVVDDDPKRLQRGKIGIQLHKGPPMRVEYRNLRIRVY